MLSLITSSRAVTFSSRRLFHSSRLLLESSKQSEQPTPPPSEPKNAVTNPKKLEIDPSSSPSQRDKLPLPFLSNALGVIQRPTSAKKTWTQKREEMVDQDLRMEKRKVIVKEATRGYFHDFHAIRSHGGKTWRAPSTLIREDRSLYFPDIKGKCLADQSEKHTVDMVHRKVSVITLLNSKISEEHTKSFYQSTLETYESHPKFQLIQINLQENVLKAYLVSLFISSLRKQISEPLLPTFLLSNQSLELVKDAIGYHNKHVGYTYLVDMNGKIRWAGCGFAEQEEQLALLSCTGILLNRLQTEKK